MAKLVELNLDPDKKTLRQFGFIAFVGFGILAALAWTERLIFSFGLGDAREIVAGTLAGVGVLAAFLGIVWPKANRALFVGLSVLAFPIGFVLSYVILGALFFLVIAPTGILLRLFGKDPMHRRYDPDAPSYWADHGAMRPRDAYFKQY